MRKYVSYYPESFQVGRHHFALFRGAIDGIALSTLGQRYLETGRDVSGARAALEWTRAALTAAAARYSTEISVTGNDDLPSLFALPSPPDVEPTVDEDDGSTTLTLEQYEAQEDPHGFFSQAELIERYNIYCASADQFRAAIDNMGVDTAIRNRLRAALDVLEARMITDPRPNDALVHWLVPSVSEPLAKAGITTFAHLVERINRRKHRWDKGIPRLGPVRAECVMRFLALNQVLPVDPRATVPRTDYEKSGLVVVEPRFGIAPMEQLALPDDLDGVGATNRGDPALCQIPTITRDSKAVEYYLTQSKGTVNPHTLRAYRSHIERFVLFLAFERQVSLSGATVEDCNAFERFLADVADSSRPWDWPSPRNAWVGPRAERWTPEWRPFTGELSARSVTASMRILRGFFNYLHRVGYLRVNPWQLVKMDRQKRQVLTHHALSEDAWRAVMEELDALDHDSEKYLRLRFVLWLGYSVGLRQDEIIRLTGESLEQTKQGWQLRVHGKGGVERTVPLDDTVMSYLRTYMRKRGHSDDPRNWRSTSKEVPKIPLLSALSSESQHAQKKRDQPMSHRGMLDFLQRHFTAAALRATDFQDQIALESASTHWLRHTAGSAMVNSDVPIAVVQELLGHADSATTAMYTHVDKTYQRAAVSKILKRAGAPAVPAIQQTPTLDTTEQIPLSLDSANERPPDL